jgi:hypothetical protein
MFLPSAKVTSSIAAQTDGFKDIFFQPSEISREAQSSGMQSPADARIVMDKARMCSDVFESVPSSYDVLTYYKQQYGSRVSDLCHSSE